MPPAESFAVEVVSRTLVRASNPPQGFPAVLPVSNLDLILGSFRARSDAAAYSAQHSFHVFFIAVYPAPAAGFPAVAAAARAALQAFLSRFYPFAGRVVPSASTGAPEVVYANAGAELVMAYADAALANVDFADADASLGRIQLVRFACGGFSLTWGTDQLLVDGHGLATLPNAVASRGSPTTTVHPSSGPFVHYNPASLPNTLLAAALVRRNYVVDAAEVDRLRAAASGPSRHATRLKALSAHVWKLLAAAVGGSDTDCRMAWLVDGRRRLDPAKYNKTHVNNYLGNVVTYATQEAATETVCSAPLADVATMAAAAIAEVFRQERYEELADWMEAHKGVFMEGGKWTEVVGLGTGSPVLVMSAFVPFRVEGHFGFGPPWLVMSWVRPGRLGSAAMTVIRSPAGDGSWLVTARMWPRLADAVDADPEAVSKPATAERLGFTTCRRGELVTTETTQHAVSRM
ncbi:hypothetical protein VPH35_127002 [Triticum aestivum]